MGRGGVSGLRFVTEEEFREYVVELGQQAGVGMTPAQAEAWAAAPLAVFRESAGERRRVTITVGDQQSAISLLQRAAEAHAFLLADLGLYL